MRIIFLIISLFLATLFSACKRDTLPKGHDLSEYKEWLHLYGKNFVNESILIDMNGVKVQGKLDWADAYFYTRNGKEFSVVPFKFPNSNKSAKILYDGTTPSMHHLVFWKDGEMINAVLRTRILDKGTTDGKRKVYETFFELDGTEKYSALVTGVYEYLIASGEASSSNAAARLSDGCTIQTFRTSTFRCEGNTSQMTCYYTYRITTRSYCPAPDEPQTPQPGDGGGGGYVEWEQHDDQNSIQTIKSDTSITNHPVVLCVYEKLMASNLQNGLRKILAGFDHNETYNVTFKIENNLGVDGRTTYLGGNEFLIRINGSDAYDSDYSRIYLAGTFIHEAFHAKLRQKAISLLGSSEISTWPKPIDDMTLSELAHYFQLSGEKTTNWNNIGHDWMVNNIDQMAISLREYVQTNYSLTYSSIGDNLDAYKTLAFMGLSGSKFYNEKINTVGDANQRNLYLQQLSVGGACNN